MWYSFINKRPKNRWKTPKKTICPVDYDKIECSKFETFELENKTTKEKFKITPNGVILLQENSKFSCIDVDKPDECPILDRLHQDCNQIHKTRNGYHFVFNGNDLPRSTCEVVDINTNLFYVTEYKNEKYEVVGKYEIIKNEGLVDMPDYAYEYCKEMITKNNKTKNITTTISEKTINKSIVNYDDRQNI